MASAQIGALRVTLALNAGEFTKGAKDAEWTLDRLGKTAAKAAGVVAAAASAAGTALALAMKGVINEADKIAKLSQSIGIPVEELSRLKHAADLSGLSLENLAPSVKKLSVNLMEMASGDDTGKAARSLAALGIAATDSSGQLKSATQVMTEVAAKFAGMQDGAGKTALAMNIFGKSGADLIPLLNSGAEGLRSMMKEADDLGLTLDTRTAKAAEAFNDNLTRLSRVKDGIVTQITARMLPALVALSEHVVGAAKQSDALKLSLELLEGTLKTIISTGVGVAALFREIGRVFGALAGFSVLAMAGEFQGALNIIRQSVTDMKAEVGADLEFLNQLWNRTAQDFAWQAQVFPHQVAAPIIASTKAMAEAERERNQARADAERILASLQTKEESHAAKLQEITILYAKGALTAQEYGFAIARMSEQAANAMRSNFTSAAGAITGALGQLFQKSKAFSIANALISTYEAFNRALANPPGPPFSYVQAAAALVSGLAQVRAIMQTNPGSGGAKSASSATAAPAAPAGGGAQAGMAQTLFVQGISPGQMFSGEAVRDLAERLLQYQRDGGKVVLA